MLRRIVLMAAIAGFPVPAIAGQFVSFAPLGGYDSLAKGDVACDGGAGDIGGHAYGARLGRGNENGFLFNFDFESYGGTGKCGGKLSLFNLGLEGEVPLTDNRVVGQLGIGGGAGIVFGGVQDPDRNLKRSDDFNGSYEAFVWYRVRLGVTGEGGVRRIFNLMPMVGWRASSVHYKEKLGTDSFGNPIEKNHSTTASGPYAHVALQIWFGRPL